VLIPGASNKDAEYVFVGGTRADVVYLGDQQVWPTVTDTPGVMGEMLILNNGNNDTYQPWRVTAPAAATKVDVVLIGGGGGGGRGSALSSGNGGGVGTWAASTYVIATTWPGRVLEGIVGRGGPGGDTVTGAQKGDPATLQDEAYATLLESFGGEAAGASGRTGTTVPDYTFNGRTYKGGIGGTSSNVNGANGGDPGGGAQGGGVEIAGPYGGRGGSGGIYLFFY